jgi:hypothetical protein
MSMEIWLRLKIDIRVWSCLGEGGGEQQSNGAVGGGVELRARRRRRGRKKTGGGGRVVAGTEAAAREDEDRMRGSRGSPIMIRRKISPTPLSLKEVILMIIRLLLLRGKTKLP